MTADPGIVGYLAAIDIGADGLPVIAHRDDVSGVPPDLRVTHCNDIACVSATSTLVEADTGWDPAMAIGSDGLPIIAHSPAVAADLRMTHCSDLACTASTHTTFSTVGINDSGNPSITIGTDGFAIVAHRASTGGFAVTHCQNVLCSVASETMFGGATNVGLEPSIAIGTDGLAIISHQDGTNKDLQVTHCNDIACTTATTTAIDTATDVGFESSIAIGTDGLPIIAHREGALNGDLRITHCSNIACTAATSTTVFASADSVGRQASITIGIDGLAVIAHYDESNANLNVTYCSNIVCSAATTTAISSPESDGNTPSIAIGRDGQVIIAHHAFSAVGLRVTKIVHMSWTANGWES